MEQNPELNAALADALLSIPPGAPNGAKGCLYFFPDGQAVFEHFDGATKHRKPISMASVRAAVNEEPIDSGWLPPNTIRWGSGLHGVYVVQFIAPGVHEFHFFMDGGKKLETLKIPLPGVIFAGQGTNYWFWAIKEPQFSPQSVLYCMPLPNIYEGGHTCWGANKRLECSHKTMAKMWRLFQEAPFTSELVENRSLSEPKDVRVLLRKLAADDATSYPLDDLVPWGKGNQKTMADRLVTTMWSNGGGR